MKILNWTNDHELRQMKRRGWSERSQEAIPEERRVRVTLYHPRQTLGKAATATSAPP